MHWTKWSALLMTITSLTLSAEPHYYYNHALVRELSPAFEESLKQEEPENPIDIKLAEKQHNDYVNVIKELIPDTRLLKASAEHPDCNFIEDTAILVGRTAIICRLGAEARRGEEVAVHAQLRGSELDQIIAIQEPGTIDGGDVLYTGKHLFIGLSSRTNQSAIDQIKEKLINGPEVVGLPVASALHLKSLISLLTDGVIVVSDETAAHEIKKEIEKRTGEYRFILTPDRTAANVLRINDSLLIQEGFPQSEKILRKEADAAHLAVIPLTMSELIKADGALTCGSLLF